MQRKGYAYVLLLSLASVCAALLSILPAGAGVTTWTYGWDSTNNAFVTQDNDGGDDCARYIEKNSDGNYVMTGYIEDSSEWDLFVMIINSSGYVQGSPYIYDGTSSGQGEINDGGVCVRETIDGGYIVVGVANSTEQDQDAVGDTLVIKLDEDLQEEWVYVDESPQSAASHVIEITEDTYVLSGLRKPEDCDKKHAFLMKITDDGSSRTVNWNRMFIPNPNTCDTYNSWFSDFRQTDNGFICVGAGYKTIGGDLNAYACVYLVFTDSSGSNETKYLVTDPDDDGTNKEYEGRGLTSQIGNGYVITGFAAQHPRASYMKQGFLWRIPEDWDEPRDTTWYSEYGDCFHTGGAQHDFGWDVHEYNVSLNQYYVMTGYTVSSNVRDLWLLKSSSSGTDEWQCAFDGASESDQGYSIEVLVDGQNIDYLTAGFATDDSQTDIYVVKTDGGTDEAQCEDCSP